MWIKLVGAKGKMAIMDLFSTDKNLQQAEQYFKRFFTGHSWLEAKKDLVVKGILRVMEEERFRAVKLKAGFEY